MKILGTINHICFEMDEGKIAKVIDNTFKNGKFIFKEIGLYQKKSWLSPFIEIEKGEKMIYSGFPEIGNTNSLRPSYKSIQLIGRTFNINIDSEINIEGIDGGVSYRYFTLKQNANDIQSSILYIKIPPKSIYKLNFSAKQIAEYEFEIAPGFNLKIFTSSSTNYDDKIFSLKTKRTIGEVIFKFTSHNIRFQEIKNVYIFCKEGQEKLAVKTRALLGKRFIPCFTIPNDIDSPIEFVRRRVQGKSPNNILILGYEQAKSIVKSTINGIRIFEINSSNNNENLICNVLKIQIPKITLRCPNHPKFAGVGLFLAIKNSARIEFVEDTNYILFEKDGIEEKIDFEDIIGKVFDQEKLNEEVIISESTFKNLLICQSVGYALMENHPIAFLPPIAFNFPTNGYANHEEGYSLIAKEIEKVVPHELRNLPVDRITVFTNDLPLHIVVIEEEVNAFKYWATEYQLAHLPRETASYIIPNYYSNLKNPTPEVNYSIIFDTLEEVTDTESNLFEDTFLKDLRYPIMLQNENAKKFFLKFLIKNLPIDLMLLVTHGFNDMLEDGDGDAIYRQDIANNHFMYSPIVFNNSCDSWNTTGTSFIEAGAQGYIGTLWQVNSKLATKLFLNLGKEFYESSSSSITPMMKDKIYNFNTQLSKFPLSYLYVGLHKSRIPTPLPNDSKEKATVFVKAFEQINALTKIMIQELSVDMAWKFRELFNKSILERFELLIHPEETPLQLPQPYVYATILDLNFFIEFESFSFWLKIADYIPGEQLTAIGYMEKHLHNIRIELANWEQKHYSNWLRRRKPNIITTSPLGRSTKYMLQLRFVISSILPFINALVFSERYNEADYWFNEIAKYIVLPTDIPENKIVDDEILLHRIKEGVNQPVKIVGKNTALTPIVRPFNNRPSLIN